MENVEFREVQEVARVERVKVVACDGRANPMPGSAAAGAAAGQSGAS